jgi:arylsulfatase A-like enzyme
MPASRHLFRPFGVLALLLFALPAAYSRPAEPIHVVWVVLDAAAARQFHLWGAPEKSTPHFDAIASEAVRFERAIAQWPATLSSTSSFLTGRYPNPLLPPQRLSEPGIASALRAAGWRTIAFSENPFVSEAHGFAREFGEFEAAPPLREESGLHDRARRDTRATIERSLEWIDREPARPFFLYLHLLPPHAPYDPPEPFAGKFQDPTYRGRFDGSMEPVIDVMLARGNANQDDLRNLRLAYLENLAYADEQLGRLHAGLSERGLLGRTLLIVSSDHGEAFGEHGQVFHGSNLYDEQLHVPLLVRFPEHLRVPPRVVPENVELADLVPTILDAAGQPPLEDGGQSLLRVALGEEPARDTARAWLTLRSKLSSSYTKGDFKLILHPTTGERELFDLAADPGESRNEVDERPNVAGYYEAALARPARTLRSEAVEVDGALRQQLEAIGYLE